MINNMKSVYNDSKKALKKYIDQYRKGDDIRLSAEAVNS
jgi:hypothetical protein